jgi:peptidoglycan/xylan/chitin deacetylase (PgdA/CDA1 family)
VRGILTYHSIDDSGSVISVRPDLFRQQAEWLASGQVQVVPLDEIEQAPPESDAVALTFDDGFDNFASVAWPELRERQLPATLFLVADYVGRTNEWIDRKRSGIPRLPLLGWDELGRLAAEGVSLGSHSRTHPDLRRLDAIRLEDEVAGSFERIHRETGVRPQTFAYPFGRHDPDVADAIRRVYRSAYTTELRFVEPFDPAHLLPRIDMYYCRRRGRLESWGSTGFQSYITVRHLLRRLRSTLV